MNTEVASGKYRAYSEYKDSGVEWLGQIPEHWNVKKLKYICKVQTGDKDTVMAVDEGKYPFFVRSQTVERINTVGADCEAVLTAGDGVGVGKVYHYYNGKFDYHQRVYMLNNFSNVLGRFVFYYLSNNFYKVALEGNAKSTVDSLRLPQFLNFEFSLPDVDVQQKIANFLDHETAKIDTLIEKQQQLIALLKEKRQAVISHAVTKGLNPNAPMRDSGVEWLGEVPEHWVVLRLKDTCDLISKKVEINNQKVVALENIESWTGKYLKTDSNYSGQDVEFIVGDILFGKLRPYLAKVYLAKEQGVAFGDLLVYRPKKELLNKYGFYLLTHEGFINTVDSSTYGSKMPRASTEFISEMTVVLPPIQEQEQIIVYVDSILERFDNLVLKAEAAIELMRERRTALISAAVTGKIDVRNWESPDSAQNKEAV